MSLFAFLLMVMWLLTLFIVIILGAIMLGIIVTELITVIRQRKRQKGVSDEFSDRQ